MATPQVQLVPQKGAVPSESALLVLYTATNNYIIQYRDLAFRAAVYTIGMLGACIGLGLNDRFKAMWSPQVRGVLLTILAAVGLSAVIFICIINRRCITLKRRRDYVERALGYHDTGAPILLGRPPDTFGMNWRYAIAFCSLIVLVMFIAIVTLSR
jgi:hypothetical protein